MAYTDTAAVRLLTSLTTSDISDADLTNIIAEAIKEVNSRLNVEVVRERAEYIDGLRENDIDGTNKTFYVKNWEGKYLADRNNDGDVDTSDVVVTLVASDDTESTATVSSITHDEGKIVLSSAPDSSTKKVLITYSWSYFDESTPDPQIKLMTTYLAAAYDYATIEIGNARSVRFGNVSILKDASESFRFFYQRFNDLVSKMGGSRLSDYKEAEIF